MTHRTESIFRPAAVRRHEQQAQAPVLPRWMPRVGRRGVPVILQMSSMDCGAACLAMILGYFGRKTSLEESREICDSSRDGVSAQTLSAAAHQFGLRTRAFSLETDGLAFISTPAIVHWNFNHFVVLERWSRTGAQIVDPASGRRQVTAREFDEAFTGVVLTLEPSASFEPQRQSGGRRSSSYLKRILNVPGTARMLLQILFASLLLQLFGFAGPLATKLLIDQILPHRISSQLTLLGLGAVLVAFAHAGLSYLRSLLLVHLEARLDSHLMLHFFEHLLSLPFRFFQQRSSGDLLMRLGSNAVIREALASYTVSALLDGSFVLVYLAALLRMSPLFGAVVLMIGLLEGILLVVVRRRVHGLMESDLAAQSASQSYLVEVLMGVSTLKASGAENRVQTRWADLLARQLNVSVERSRFSAGIDSAMTLMRTFAPLFLLWIGGVQVMSGVMSLGTMLAVSALAAAFLLPVNSLVAGVQRLQLAGAHLKRLEDVMEAQPEQNASTVRAASALTGRIEMRNVSFRYDAQAPLALRNVSLTIGAGQKVALVGKSGSGKSTLARLLLGLYVPAEGDILYDGVSLSALDYHTVRRQWGAVLQEPCLFSASLRQNIAFHDPEISLDQVREAARIAALDDDIQQMPMRFETRLDEGGGSLSGGQRQRLAIARAVARKPPLLLLDEATSHLDVLTERLVQQNLDDLACTQVVIAHRLSTIRNADLIVVLEEGSLVEQGSHEELLSRNGYYADLVRDQPGVMVENLA